MPRTEALIGQGVLFLEVQSTLSAQNTMQIGAVGNWTSSAKYKGGIGRLKDFLGKKPADFL